MSSTLWRIALVVLAVAAAIGVCVAGVIAVLPDNPDPHPTPTVVVPSVTTVPPVTPSPTHTLYPAVPPSYGPLPASPSI